MSVNKRPMRYAHSDGHTDVCYSEDGKYLITGGNDGDIRLWMGLEDDDPTSHCVGERALAVKQMGKRLFVGTDNNTVQAYTFPEVEPDGIITRFGAPVTHISVSKDGNTIAAASEDMEVHIYDVALQKSTVIASHTGPVFGVELDPKLEFVASCSGDGTVRVWNLSQNKLGHSWKCVPICNSFLLTKVLGRPSWLPSTGQLLALPNGKQVCLYKRGTWEQMTTLTNAQVEKEFSIVTFSPCGKYLAGCTIGGDICVWDIKQESCVMHEIIKNKSQVCALAWNPSVSGELGYCDLTGQLGTIEGCIPVELNSNLNGSLKSTEITTNKHTVKNSDFPFEPLIDDDDDDDENVISLDKIKAESTHPANESDLPNVLDDLDDDDAQSKVSLKISELQPPFQPSATPQHLQHRFMVWNSVGIVRCSNVPEDVIDVEFHDTSVHHALYIKNYMHHHIASLTQHALVLACEAEDGPSKLVCVLLNCWDGTREWQVDLPEGEGALCVALGEGWLAAATDTRMLRIWTLCGSQREVVTLPGPVLCLAGHKHKLIVVCHVGIGVAGDQNVSYCVMNLIRGQMSPWQPLPLTPGSTVQWIGFSDEGTPFMMDSTGSVRMLSSKGFWLPVLDTKTHVKGKSDHYFILGVSEKFQNIRAVLCKGSHYPPTTPRPPVVEVPLQVGLGDVTTERGQLEEIFWRSTLTGPSIPDPTDLEKAAKEAIIKLFALACRSDQQARAVELCSLMQGPQVVQLAMKYASKLGKSHLADRIADMDFSHLDAQQRSVNEYDRQPTHFQNNQQNGYNYNDSYNNYVSSNQSFNESQNVTQDDKVHSSPEKENILITAKRKAQQENEGINNIRPAPVLGLSQSQKKLNPFKKCAGKSEVGRGLDNLASSANKIKVNSSNGQFKISMNSSAQRKRPDNNHKQSKITELTKSESSPSSKEQEIKKVDNPITFVEWFSQEKTALQEEFPNLGPAELTKQGMKRFKEIRNNLSPQVPDIIPSNDTDTAEEDSKKRKTMNCETEAQTNIHELEPLKKKTNVSLKLSSFMFKKTE